MISKEEIVIAVKNFLAAQIDVNVDLIQSNADLKSLGLDSFRIIELVLFCERKTSLTFPEHAYTPANLKSIESIANCFIAIQK